ncbi:UNVERIFIED_CONTAM: Activating signal cointegrator 1 [Sesamum angustifolium]|uniref:Activating signal cointegrator 1 n=1 Tax=Sesamum angustifolium TaxID=2727405 RepID=A0AAW2LUQ2_9LAMI
MASRRRVESSNYRNPCLTMHQPWASLLVYGIKRVEGRSWPAPVRGRLWIHAASKIPEPETIRAMEDFYREIYAMNGITDVKFPEHYPVSRLLGCVDVVGCVTCEELVNWEELPASHIHARNLNLPTTGETRKTAFCWLCEQPQKLIIPFEMRGYQGVYNLEKKIYESAVRGLSSVKPPLPVKFPLPDPKDPYSLKPSSLASRPNGSRISEEEKSPSLVAAIAGARAAATQFAKNNMSPPTTGVILKVMRSPYRPEQGRTQGKGFSDLVGKIPENSDAKSLSF